MNNFSFKSSLLSLGLLMLVSVSVAQPMFDEPKVKQHLTELSSDAYAGRFPGTEGDAMAQAYMVEQLSKIDGVELYGNDGRQRFSLVMRDGSLYTPENAAKFGNQKLTFRRDYTPVVFSNTGEFSAPVVFAGYGFDTPGVRNDFEGVDLKGRWAMIIRETPTKAGRADFVGDLYDYIKVREASLRGAVGVLLVHGSKDYWRILDSYERWPAKSDIPVLSLSSSAADRILKSSGKTIKGLEQAWRDEPQRVQIESRDSLSALVAVDRKVANTANIVAFIKGRGAKASELVVLGAHLDHVGVNLFKTPGSTEPATMQVYNGANDNASGSVALLAFAERYAKMQTKMKRSVMIALFSAEEQGLVGSKYMVDNLDDFSDYGEVKFMFNFDMIGSLPRAKDSLMVYGVGTFDEGHDMLNKFRGETYIKIKEVEGADLASDHKSFYTDAAVPVLGFYTADAADMYHKPKDDVEYIDFDSMLDIMEFSTLFMDEVILKRCDVTLTDKEM